MLQMCWSIGQRKFRIGAGWLIACVMMLGVLLAFGTRSVAAHELQRYTLDIKAVGIPDADISPDDRFVAVYVVHRTDLQARISDEIVREIQIWDWQAGKVVARKVVLRERRVLAELDLAGGPFIRYADAGSRLVVYQEGHLLVSNSATLEKLQDIDLGKSQWPPPRPWPYPVRPNEENPHVADIEVASSAPRVAVLLRWGFYGGGELRVYDLASGELLRKWDFPAGSYGEKGLTFSTSRPIAIDSQGKRIAVAKVLAVPVRGSAGDVTMGATFGKLPSESRNVLILDVDSGETTTAINTGYSAASVCFASGDPLAVLTVLFHDSNRDSISMWNANTGKLIREIASPPEGVHYFVDASASGRIALGYISRTKTKISLGDPFVYQEILYSRFRLWDLTTGKVLATSPDLPKSGGYPWFRLSPKGDLVLFYSPSSDSPPQVYQLQ